MSLPAKVRNGFLKAAAAVRFRRFGAKLAWIRAAEIRGRRKALRMGGEPLRHPASLTIRITERCFLKCEMCGQNGPRGRFKGSLSAERQVFDAPTLERTIEEVGRWPVKPFFKITGGEPLVERELTLSALERASGLGLVTKLNTNGVLLADGRVARRIAFSGLNYLSVSIDGPPEIHDLIRGRAGCYDTVLRGIREVRKYGRDRGARPPMILVSAIVSRLNQDRILDLARRMSAARVDWLNIQFMNFTTPEFSESARAAMRDAVGTSESPWEAFINPGLADVDAGIVAEEIRAVKEARLAIPVSVLGIGRLSARRIADYHQDFNLSLKSGVCPMPYASAFLVPPAWMTFCVDYPLLNYADLREVSMEAGWRSEKARAFRAALAGLYAREKTNFPQCRRCNWRFN
jgi:uncharacterized Fe-S cluster-containing radical SAM superfamily protein